MGRSLCSALFAAGLAGACTSPGVELGDSQHDIVGGQETTDYPAVAFLRLSFANGQGGGCSGTLVSPRVVLTAAHCVDPEDTTLTELEAYFGSAISGDDPVFVESIPAVDWDFADGWSLSGGDFALVLLERDAAAEPMPFNTEPLTDADLGKELHLVGWGNSREGVGAGVKRHVFAELTHFQNDWLLGYGDAEGNTCQGDSGGPSFMTIDGRETVVGVTSWGIEGCLGESGAGRVARYAADIERFIAERDLPQPPELAIVRPADGATVGPRFAVEVDASDDTGIERLELYIDGAKVADIPTAVPPYIVDTPQLPAGPATIEVVAADNRGDETRQSVTVTVDASADTGGALGDLCAGNGDCDSGLCATVSDLSLCTSECAPAGDQCPAGFECLADTPERGYCWPDSGADAGGCRAGGPSGVGGLLLAVGGLMLARRRRR